MPKISKNIISTHVDKLTVRHEVDVMYSSEETLFYIKVPEKFIENVKHLSDKDEEKYFIYRFTRRIRCIAVIGATESEVLSRTKVLLEHLQAQTIVKRNVIIVFFDPDDTCIYGDMEHNDKHPQIGMKFGLTYATETSSGDKKIYHMVKKYKAFGKTETCYNEIRLWGKDCTVIDDTPESRETLEALYKAFKNVNDKLKEFTKTPEALLAFIDSKQKFLQAP